MPTGLDRLAMTASASRHRNMLSSNAFSVLTRQTRYHRSDRFDLAEHVEGCLRRTL